MIGMAVLFDSIDLFLGLGLFGFVANMVATPLFGIWFSHNDVSIMHPDRALKFLGTIVLETTPLSGVPLWSYTVYTTVKNEWRSVAV